MLSWGSSYLDLGDRLWCQGEYSQAMVNWREAARSDDPATKAMANYRILLKASNLAWVYYGLQGDVALSDCSLNDSRCALANVDREIFMSMLRLPADLQYAEDIAERLVEHLPAEATARLVWLGKRDFEDLNYYPELDGMGACLIQGDEWPRGPGGAYYGFGLYGGGQMGLGGSASWTQPNIDKKGGVLQVSGALTSKLSGGFYLNYYSVGERWIRFSSSVQNAPYYRYVDGVPEFHLIEMTSIEITPGFQTEKARFWAGLYGRIDQFSDSKYSLGPVVGGEWRPLDTLEWQGDISYTWIDYQHLRIDNRLIWIHSTGLAAMLNLYATPVSEVLEEDLWWRIPTVGGGTILRTAPGQRWRDPFLPSAVFEYRYKPMSTIGVVAFSEVAYAEKSVHGGGGLGLRIRMPPQPYNTIRFDIGYGDSGWNILFGAEEFFRFRN